MNNSFGTEILLAEEKFKKKVHKVFPLEGKLTNRLNSLIMNFIDVWWLLKEPFLLSLDRLLAAGILRHCFCSLTHCVLGKLTGQEQADCRLDFT